VAKFNRFHITFFFYKNRFFWPWWEYFCLDVHKLTWTFVFGYKAGFLQSRFFPVKSVISWSHAKSFSCIARSAQLQIVFFKVYCFERPSASQTFPTVSQNTAGTRFTATIKTH